MASHIHVELHFADGESPDYGDIRQALSELTEDDVSVSSPISAGAPEAGVSVDGRVAHVRVAGHDGDWTKTSEEAIVSALRGVPGDHGDPSVVGGGYEPDE